MATAALVFAWDWSSASGCGCGCGLCSCSYLRAERAAALGRCLIDTMPRRFSADKLRMLSGFADMAVRQLEKRRALHHQRRCSFKCAARTGL